MSQPLPLDTPVPGTAPRLSCCLAPFGVYTRFMLAAYLRGLLMIVSVLLSIALTIDLWPQIDTVIAAGSGNALRNLVVFCLLRSPHLLAPLLPFATFLAVWMVEITHTRNGERLLVANTGRSPLKSLCPAILLGLLAGPVTFTLDGLLSPASMREQIHEGLGRDALRLDRHRISDLVWIDTPEGLVSGHIAYEPPMTLRDITIFRFDPRFLMDEIIKAPVATPIPHSSRWRLDAPLAWKNGQQQTDTLLPLPAGEMTVTLSIYPRWLSVYGVDVQYLTLQTLRKLAHHDGEGYDAAPYRTRLAMLYSTLILPTIMAVLACILCGIRLPYAPDGLVAATILAWGYAAHVATRICLLLGQTNVTPAWLAVSLVPCGLVIALIIIVRRKRGAA